MLVTIKAIRKVMLVQEPAEGRLSGFETFLRMLHSQLLKLHYQPTIANEERVKASQFAYALLCVELRLSHRVKMLETGIEDAESNQAKDGLDKQPK